MTCDSDRCRHERVRADDFWGNSVKSARTDLLASEQSHTARPKHVRDGRQNFFLGIADG